MFKIAHFLQIAKTLDLLLYKVNKISYLGMIWVTTTEYLKDNKIKKEIVYYSEEEGIYK